MCLQTSVPKFQVNAFRTGQASSRKVWLSRAFLRDGLQLGWPPAQSTWCKGCRELTHSPLGEMLFRQKSVPLCKRTSQALQSEALLVFSSYGAWQSEIKKLASFTTVNISVFGKGKGASENKKRNKWNVFSPLLKAQNKSKTELQLLTSS